MRIRRLASLAYCLVLALLGCVGAAFGQSARPGYGSIPYSNGVTFRTWAPNASSVAVKGTFNGWGNTALKTESNGYWSIDVAGATAGQQYKYRINNSFDRRDPRARRVTASNGNSIIYDPNAFNWGGVVTPTPAIKDLVIYQMHVGTFEGGTPPRTFDHAITKLDHVQKLGISAIKVMPVTEFPGGLSWGYNPAEAFAIESDYGSADAFKRFVKAAHERGIAVFVDIVHNHHGPTDLDAWRFDGWYQGTYGGIYYYNDTRANTPWGTTRPDFGRSEVRQFIRDQVFMFVDEYHAGGFRWDSVYNILNTDQGPNTQGRDMLGAINLELLQTRPNVIRGSEDNAFDFSINFQTQWDVGYRWDLHGQITTASDANRNMSTVAGLLGNWASHNRVVFSEAHDYIAANHGRSRIPSEIDPATPDSIWARKRALLGAGIVMTTPGVPMIFQGQEMHETQAFHDNIPLRWTLTNTYRGIVNAYTDLIQSRRNKRDGMQGLKGTGINVHHIDNVNKVVAYIRWDAGGQVDDVLVAANFSATLWTNNNYSIQFPSAGTWYRHFNSDSTNYQADFGNVGATQLVAAGSPPSAMVNMGSYSLQIFSKTPPGAEPPPPPIYAGTVSFDPEAPAGCVDVTITYDSTNGPLELATNVILHLGRNGWQGVVDLPMTNQGAGLWITTVGISTGASMLDLVFNNGGATWDNNGGSDWHLPVTGCQAPSAPMLTTAPISAITPTTATGGGNVTNDGGSAVTERGVVWGIAPSPTTADNKGTAGSGMGSFTNQLSGLTAGRTYYVRAFGTSGGGTGYGDERVFTAGCFSGSASLLPPTLVTETNFQANWNALTGAASYQLELSTNAAFSDGAGGAPYSVNFEGAGEVKTFYGVGTVTLAGVSWRLDQAQIGTSGNDRKNGARSGRMRRSGSTPGTMTMLQDLTNGLQYIRFVYARYGTDTAQPNLFVEYSTNQGTNWTLIGTIAPPLPSTLTTFSNNVNVAGSLRVRFRTDTTGTDQRRLNIDDIVMAPMGGAIVQTFVSTSTSHVVDGLSSGNTYYYRVKALGGGSCASGLSSTQSVFTAPPQPTGLVDVAPDSPQGCVPVVFTYTATNGPLLNVPAVYLELGHNDWLNPLSILMSNVASNVWSTTYAIPPETWQLDYVFHDGGVGEARIWDNNNYLEWQTYVTGCGVVEFANLMITNPSSDAVVPYSVLSYTFQGTAQNILGSLSWENVSTGETGSFASVSSWTVPAVDLSVGANLFRITGTTSSENPNDGARDSASNTTYTSVNNWTNGSDGGQGWGGGWTFSATANSGHFLASGSSSNLNFLPNAWGLWANNGGLCDATRSFADHLREGDAVSVKFDNNWIDNGASVGIGFRNGFGQNLFEFMFVGGGTNYIINDSISGQNTAIPWTGSGLSLSFELTSPTDYRFLVNTQEFTGTLATSSEALVRRVRVWNFNAGPGWERNLYFTDLAVDGALIPGQDLSAERTVQRNYGPHYLSTPVTNPTGWKIFFPVTEAGQLYDVQFCTNLPMGVWTPLGLNLQGSGIPLTVILTNALPAEHFRTTVHPLN